MGEARFELHTGSQSHNPAKTEQCCRVWRDSTALSRVKRATRESTGFATRYPWRTAGDGSAGALPSKFMNNPGSKLVRRIYKHVLKQPPFFRGQLNQNSNDLFQRILHQFSVALANDLC